MCAKAGASPPSATLGYVISHPVKNPAKMSYMQQPSNQKRAKRKWVEGPVAAQARREDSQFLKNSDTFERRLAQVEQAVSKLVVAPEEIQTFFSKVLPAAEEKIQKATDAGDAEEATRLEMALRQKKLLMSVRRHLMNNSSSTSTPNKGNHAEEPDEFSRIWVFFTEELPRCEAQLQKFQDEKKPAEAAQLEQAMSEKTELNTSRLWRIEKELGIAHDRDGEAW